MEDQATMATQATTGGNRRLRITLVKSVIGYRESQRLTVKSLGLRRMHQTVEHYDSPTIRGMVAKVQHLVRVEEVDGSTPLPPRETGTQRFAARLARRAAEREALIAEWNAAVEAEQAAAPIETAAPTTALDPAPSGVGNLTTATDVLLDELPEQAMTSDEVEGGTTVFRPSGTGGAA